MRMTGCCGGVLSLRKHAAERCTNNDDEDDEADEDHDLLLQITKKKSDVKTQASHKSGCTHVRV